MLEHGSGWPSHTWAAVSQEPDTVNSKSLRMTMAGRHACEATRVTLASLENFPCAQDSQQRPIECLMLSRCCMKEGLSGLSSGLVGALRGCRSHRVPEQ